MTGYVEQVAPMRTILRTDSCVPVTIPNKVGKPSREALHPFCFPACAIQIQTMLQMKVTTHCSVLISPLV